MKKIIGPTLAAVSLICVSAFVFAGNLPNGSGTNPDPRTVQMPGGMMNGEGMRGMMQRMMPDMLPPGANPQDLPDPGSPGAKLVARYCSQCHNLPSPAMHAADQWPPVADRMFYRMSMMSGMGMMMRVASPTSEEQQKITAYLQSHALKSISPAALPSPDSPGAAQFKKSCSQCHPLPDPKLHTAAEWPKIVPRMEAHISTMHKTPISGSEKKDIVNYLTRNARQ